jgi:hypothetical protein
VFVGHGRGRTGRLGAEVHGLVECQDEWYGGEVTRTALHRLVDELPEESLEPVAVILQRAKDPGLANHDAGPWEDEPISAEEEEEAATEARREAERGEVTPCDQVKRELLTD